MGYEIMDTRGKNELPKGVLVSPLENVFTLEKEFVFPEKNWRSWLRRERSGLLCLDCCPCDPDLYWQYKGDGWI